MCLNPQYLKGNVVPCRKCIQCLIDYSVQWQFRVMLEASLYNKNCVVTLTYNEANCPEDSRLRKADFQKFIKRVRKKFSCRYFGCGEYGKKNGRPHYHIILFGVDFDDKYYFCTDKKGTKLFRSPTLEKLWKFGFSTVGDLTFDTAKYVTKYLQKVLNENDDSFLLQSRKPPIGLEAFKKSWFETDKIYVNGKYIKLPRSFIDIFIRKGLFIEDIENLKFNRKKNMRDFYSNYMSDGGNNVDYALFDKDLRKKIEKFSKIFNLSLDKVINFKYNKEKKKK